MFKNSGYWFANYPLGALASCSNNKYAQAQVNIASIPMQITPSSSYGATYGNYYSGSVSLINKNTTLFAFLSGGCTTWETTSISITNPGGYHEMTAYTAYNGISDAMLCAGEDPAHQNQFLHVLKVNWNYALNNVVMCSSSENTTSPGLDVHDPSNSGINLQTIVIIGGSVAATIVLVLLATIIIVVKRQRRGIVKTTNDGSHYRSNVNLLMRASSKDIRLQNLEIPKDGLYRSIIILLKIIFHDQLYKLDFLFSILANQILFDLLFYFYHAGNIKICLLKHGYPIMQFILVLLLFQDTWKLIPLLN